MEKKLSEYTGYIKTAFNVIILLCGLIIALLIVVNITSGSTASTRQVLAFGRENLSHSEDAQSDLQDTATAESFYVIESVMSSEPENEPVSDVSYWDQFFRSELLTGGSLIEDGSSFNTNVGFEIDFYTIKPNDTLYKISRLYHVSIDAIISFNDITEGHHIVVGRILTIPNQDGILYKVKDNDTLIDLCARYNINVNYLRQLNCLNSDDALKSGDRIYIPGVHLSENERAMALALRFVTPVEGRISSLYGMRTDPFTHQSAFHPGIDIAAPTGTDVQAMKNGTVILAKWYGGYGKCVIIDHGEGLQTRYGHLSEILVSEGYSVAAGKIIGEVGSTGNSTGPHLHFEVRQDGEVIDPSHYFSGRLGEYLQANYDID